MFDTDPEGDTDLVSEPVREANMLVDVLGVPMVFEVVVVREPTPLRDDDGVADGCEWLLELENESVS